jgi:hypothetical protein
MGTDGKKDVVVNSFGREMKGSAGAPTRPAHPAHDRLRHAARPRPAFTNGFSGAAAFLDPRTGEILAMTVVVMRPNDFANGMDRSKLSSLNRDPLKPFRIGLFGPARRDRRSSRSWRSRSVQHVITPDTKFFCPGYITLYGRLSLRQQEQAWLARSAPRDRSPATSISITSANFWTSARLRVRAALGSPENGHRLPGEAKHRAEHRVEARTQKEKWYPGETISVRRSDCLRRRSRSRR